MNGWSNMDAELRIVNQAYLARCYTVTVPPKPKATCPADLFEELHRLSEGACKGNADQAKVVNVKKQWRDDGKCPECGELGRYSQFQAVCSTHGPYDNSTDCEGCTCFDGGDEWITN